MAISKLKQFYENAICLILESINKETGHFNVFNLAGVRAQCRDKAVLPYNRRAYYKISLIQGRNKAEYADVEKGGGKAATLQLDAGDIKSFGNLFEQLNSVLKKKFNSAHFNFFSVVAPGAIETDFGGGRTRDNKEINAQIAGMSALGRVGLPDNIGGMML